MQRLAATAGALTSLAFAASGSAAATDGALVPAILTVHIKDFKYDPTPATVHAGELVAFVNDDDEAHTITSDDRSFDSGGLDGAHAWQHVFSKAGTYHYFCALHPFMKAIVAVLPPASSAK